MTMPPDRWKRVRALFERAEGIAPADRDAWLRGECGDDTELLADVGSLLRHDSGPGAIEGAVADAILEHDAAATSRVGTTVGAYRVLQRIGEGGMGTVWLAERTDGAFDKRVALKVVRGALDSRQLAERFRRERQILAQLDHPGIARILDGGQTDDGLPYLVLEHVAGKPIDDHVREPDLPLAARVDLFLEVCDAVEYAHRRLILHRDLKPDNILVGDDGRPRLLDFGIAKALEDGDDPGLTGTTARMMTLAYAAPEQIRGEPVSTATDVYGLGAVLYELIVGDPPFRAATSRELETAVLEHDPESPSRRSGSRGTDEVDDIVLMALRKDAAMRYPTVAEMAADLRRWRQGHPVIARPPTFAYRSGKFLRRNRVAVAAGTAAMIALVIGTAGLATGMVRAQRAEAEARREAATSERVADFLVGLFRSADPNRERGSVTVRELLDEGAASIAGLEEEPLVMARLLGTMGIAYSELGAFERAREHFERALAARELALGPDHPDVAESLNNLANVEKLLGRFDDAASHYERSIAIKAAKHGADSPEVARTLYGLARVREEQGDLEAARSTLARVLAAQEASPEAAAPDVANTLNMLAGLVMKMGDGRASMDYLNRSIDLNTQALGKQHPTVIGQQTNLAILALRNNDPARARELCESTLPRLEEMRGPNHPMVAVTLNVLAEALESTGDADAALPLLERSLGIWEAAVGPDHPQTVEARDRLERLDIARAARE